MAKYFIRFFWIAVIFSIIRFQPASISGIQDKTVPYLDYNDTAISTIDQKPIAILGDLQRTTIWEVMVGREQNDSERINLINEIKKENPAMLVLLGDMVSNGGEVKEWNYFDTLITPIKNIPLLPVMGNHDYSGSREMPGFNFAKKRFTQINGITWYTRRYGNIALIFLDTNESQIPSSKWEEQKRWYENMLSVYDKDPGIKGIFVFTHHPPYTNSIVTGDEKNIKDTFVKAFEKSEKTLAFFSGHAHTYENFKIHGKTYIVSGGGGGPRVFLRKGSDCHKDQCTYKGIRPFHYILLQPEDNSVNIVVKGINKNENIFFLVDNLKIDYSLNQNELPVISKN